MDKFSKLLDEMTEELNELIKELGIDKGKKVDETATANPAEEDDYEIELSDDEHAIAGATDLMKLYRALQLVGFTKDEAFEILLTSIQATRP